MAHPKHRRKRFVIDKKFQLGVSLHIIGMVYLYLVLFALLANLGALRTVISGGTDDAEYIEAVSRLQVFVEVFVVPLVFTFICMCLHGVLFSHRLAGPIYRFKETLRRIRGGDLAMEIKIRENDYFQDLCDEVNSLVVRLRENLLQFRETSSELAEAGEQLADTGDLPPEARERMLKIATASTKLRQFFESYTLERPAEPEAGTQREAAHPSPVASRE